MKRKKNLKQQMETPEYHKLHLLRTENGKTFKKILPKKLFLFDCINNALHLCFCFFC